MATHDYVLDNASGANFRADINNALAAIVSNNSSSSEPSTKYAYQWWADTNEGVLKIRNSSNDGWITLLQLDGTLTLEDGSASAPALGFRDDLNTGIFSSAADTLDVSCGGTTRGSFSSSGLTVTGNVTATTFVGNVDAVDGDFDGTLEADAITVGGTALATVIAGTTVTTATNANHISVADNESTNENNLIPFIEDASATGNVGLESDGDFTYNPSTGTVTATAFVGSLTGNVTGNASGSSGSCTGNSATATTSTNVTAADESSDTTCFPLFVTAATGDLPPKTGSNLAFNSSNGTLTATAFSGDGSNLTNLPSGGGKILQVVSTTRTDTFSETIVEANFTAAALSVTIDNVASGSKIFVMATLTMGLSNDNEVEFAFFKGGSIITGAIGATAGNRTRSHAAGRVNATSSPGFVAGSFLDTSPGTGSITYDARLSHQNNGSATVYLNRSHSDTNADQDSRMASTITVFEVGA